jgi:exodeoxyribonuclease VII large subunit
LYIEQIHDIITVARRRNPNIELVVAPTSVQGAEAPDEIAIAMKLLNNFADLDLIILARGGGSFEELWAFNTEEVARAIYDSKLPVVSAVGHETDITIADLVADLRAATPSAAAEMVIPSIQDMQEKLQKQSIKLSHTMKAIIETSKLKISYIAKSKVMSAPLVNLDQYKQTLDYSSYRIQNTIGNLITTYQTEIEKSIKQLNALNPLAILQRGYAICKTKDEKYISKISHVVQNDELRVILQDGYLDCRVIAKGEQI